jgi:AcrR family transcriptional regulator
MDRAGQRARRRIDDDRREDLLARLEAIVLDEGFAKLTGDQMCTRLRCSKATLYAISSSREYLVSTALKRFFRAATERVESRVAEADEPAERIAVYLEAVGGQMRRMSPACFADMMANDATRDIYELNSRAAGRRVHELIAEGVEAGRFRPLHAEFVGASVGLLIEGIQSGALLVATGLSSGDAFVQLGDLVLSALAPSCP